jgi:SAM-dependent methyltransferase
MRKNMGNRCRICGNTKRNKLYQIEERMFNMGEDFEYLECSRCGTLQLNIRGIDFGKYYPANYGGFNTGVKEKGKAERIVSRIIAKTLTNLNYSLSNRLNDFLGGKFDYLQCFFGLKIKRTSRILDVGCGSGEWLAKLSALGYENLTGVDLYNHNKNREFEFIEGDIFSVPTKKKFDVITLHHSFEHMDSPEKNLLGCKALLADNGILIIRIPVMGKYAWKKYGTAWAQIDAPRHLFLYTEKSLNYLLKKCGLKLTAIRYDSNYLFQIGASEIYKKTRLSLQMARRKGDLDEISTQDKKLVRRLNQRKNGDQAIFVIKSLAGCNKEGIDE